MCLKLMLTEDVVFQDKATKKEIAVIRPYLNKYGEFRIAVESPVDVEIFRRAATLGPMERETK